VTPTTSSSSISSNSSSSEPWQRLKVHHITGYHYDYPVTDSVNTLRLHPRQSLHQKIENHLLSVFPPIRLTSSPDLNGNRVHHVEIKRPHTSLRIENRLTVSIQNPVEHGKTPYGIPHESLSKCRHHEDTQRFLENSSFVELTPEIYHQALAIQADSNDVFETAYAITNHLFEQCQYVSGSTDVTTSAGDFLQNKVGVCQDFAHGMVALCRSIHIPARYISGYLFDSSPDTGEVRGAGATHAWVEIFIPSNGWIALDPTNNLIVNENYITLAHGRDYQDVAPVAGSYLGGSGTHLEVKVKVERV